MRYIYLIVLSLLITECSQYSSRTNQTDTFNSKRLISINLSKEYKLTAKLNDEFAKDSCYDSLVIFENERPIFSSRENDFFVICDKSRPMLFHEQKSNIIMLEIDARPDVNKIVAFVIKDNKVQKIDTLPQFEEQPKDIDNDNKLEVYGIMNLVEAYCADCDSSYYNPTLVYKITETGFVLDSINTIKMNKKIWGDFYGFKIQYKVLSNKKIAAHNKGSNPIGV